MEPSVKMAFDILRQYYVVNSKYKEQLSYRKRKWKRLVMVLAYEKELRPLRPLLTPCKHNGCQEECRKARKYMISRIRYEEKQLEAGQVVLPDYLLSALHKAEG